MNFKLALKNKVVSLRLEWKNGVDILLVVGAMYEGGLNKELPLNFFNIFPIVIFNELFYLPNVS